MQVCRDGILMSEGWGGRWGRFSYC